MIAPVTLNSDAAATVPATPTASTAAICLMGPTGTGKSDIALALAERLPVEIISVDSAMIYRGMDVGTAKPARQARERVAHHLIDIRDPAERYSAADFASDARQAMAAIRARGRIPLLVGGTFLYFRALTDGLSPLPGADARVREELRREARDKGWRALHAELKRLDPATAARIHANDRQRIERALELYRVTGTPPSRLRGAAAGAAAAGTPFVRIALWPPDRNAYRTRLARRFHAMTNAGLVGEVRALHARGDLGPANPAVRCLGYRQLWDWLENRCNFDEAVRRAVVATQRYAKRQLTWLRSETGLMRIETDSQAGERVLETAARRISGGY